MKRRGFTLVEMLAVIAIIGILAVMVLPNVLKNYRDAKKIAFIDEAKTIYSKSTDKFVYEKTKGNKIGMLTNEQNSLELTNANDLEYTVRIDSDGRVTAFRLANNEFCIIGIGDFLNSYTKEDVIDMRDEEEAVKCQLADISEGEVLTVNFGNDLGTTGSYNPGRVYLLYNKGWSKSKTMQLIEKVSTPSKTNNYYEGAYVKNIDGLVIRMLNCNGTIAADNTGGGIFTGREESKVVTARSKFIQKYYQVKYELNDGEGSIPTLKVPYGEQKNLDKNRDSNGYGINIKRTGFLFDGWTSNGQTFRDGDPLPLLTDSNENSNSYYKYDSEAICQQQLDNSNDINPANTNIKSFVPIWTAIKYNITYDYNDGQPNGTYPTEGTYNELVTVPNPKRTGYTFTGWTITGYDATTAKTGTSSDVNSLNTNITDNVKNKYYKNLTPINNSTVNFKANWKQNYVVMYFSAQNSTTTPLATIKNEVVLTQDAYHLDGTKYANAGDVYNFELREDTILGNQYKNIIYYNSPNNRTFRKVVYNAYYGDSLEAHGDGLPAPHNCASFICLERENYTYKPNAEWKCIGGECSGKEFDHRLTTYKDSDFCDCSAGNCTVVLELNWDYSTYKITLNNSNADSTGTTEIYEKYNTGWYSNSSASTSTSITKISLLPKKNNYTFTGYYDGNTRIIKKDGTIEVSNTTFTSNKTITAKWCNNCRSDANGSCTVNIKNDGTCTYTTSCNSGYTIENNGKYNYSCKQNITYYYTYACPNTWIYKNKAPTQHLYYSRCYETKLEYLEHGVPSGWNSFNDMCKVNFTGAYDDYGNKKNGTGWIYCRCIDKLGASMGYAADCR